MTLPPDTVEEIDRLEANRSRFVLEAVRRELKRRWRLELRRSLQEPHAEASAVAEEGFGAWVGSQPGGEAAGLLDPDAGQAVRWLPGLGWSEEDE